MGLPVSLVDDVSLDFFSVGCKICNGIACVIMVAATSTTNLK